MEFKADFVAEFSAEDWRASTLRAIERAAIGAAAIRVQPYGSMATGRLDDWSDVDALVVVPDERIDGFWPGLDWLPSLYAGVVARRTYPASEGSGGMTHLMLEDGHKVDIMVVEESLAEARLRDLSDLRTKANPHDLGEIANQILFKAMDAVHRAVRGERLNSTELAVGVIGLCLDAASLIRDLSTGICVHRTPAAEDELVDLIPAIPAAAQPIDVLRLIPCALDWFERILHSGAYRIPFPREGVDRLIERAIVAVERR